MRSLQLQHLCLSCNSHRNKQLLLLFTGTSCLFHVAVVVVNWIQSFISCCCCLQDLVIYFMLLLVTGSSHFFSCCCCCLQERCTICSTQRRGPGSKAMVKQTCVPTSIGVKCQRKTMGQMSEIKRSNVRDQTVKCQSTAILQLSDSNQS